MAMNRNAFPYQLDKSIEKMFTGTYAELPVEYTKIAKIDNFGPGSTRAEAEISPLGGLLLMSEGSPVLYDDVVEGHKKTWTTVKYGRGFGVTREMIEDELFGAAVSRAKSLARSTNQCLETAFWNLLNLGFSTTLAWDGLSLFNDAHVTMKSATTIDNNVASDLSMTSLEAGFQHFDNSVVDEAGMKLLLKPRRLIVNPADRGMAYSLRNANGMLWNYTNYSIGQVNTGAANVIGASVTGDGPQNWLNPAKGEVADWQPFVCHYLSDADSWFLLTDDADLRLYWKRKPSIETTEDFNSEMKLYKTSIRFSVGAGDYKGCYGSAGA